MGAKISHLFSNVKVFLSISKNKCLYLLFECTNLLSKYSGLLKYSQYSSFVIHANCHGTSVNINIYNLMGHKIKSLVRIKQEAGYRSIISWCCGL